MKKAKPLKNKERDNSELLEKLNGHVEITPEQRIARESTISSILQQSKQEEIEAKLKKEARNAEIFELLGGTKTSYTELSALVTSQRSPYEALFPNTKAFWQQIFKLNGWDNLDPSAYVKPPIVGKWVCELIYNRYIKEVLPALRKNNPASGNGFRQFKHFQFLTKEAKEKLEQFRDDAIALMEVCVTWVEFRQKYLLRYGIGYQTDLFDKAE